MGLNISNPNTKCCRKERRRVVARSDAKSRADAFLYAFCVLPHRNAPALATLVALLPFLRLPNEPGTTRNCASDLRPRLASGCDLPTELDGLHKAGTRGGRWIRITKRQRGQLTVQSFMSRSERYHLSGRCGLEDAARVYEFI